MTMIIRVANYYGIWVVRISDGVRVSYTQCASRQEAALLKRRAQACPSTAEFLHGVSDTHEAYWSQRVTHVSHSVVGRSRG